MCGVYLFLRRSLLDPKWFVTDMSVCYCSLTVQNYNFRSYAVRRVKEDFRKNKTLEPGSVEQKKVLELARQQVDVLYRQMIVSKLYPPHVKSVMETIG